MKMKVTAALAAMMAVGATCAFAANPFVDVPTDSWAYKSVVELADSGIIQGVDGTHFEGGRNITRYEAAEIVAKAMAHMDKASVEQRALINKLADEYADELNNLGVRVSALENKVGNVKLTGDARVRYRYQQDSKENDSSWDYRVRLRATANVNDNTTVRYGLSTDSVSFADNNAASASENNPFTDRAEVVTKLGNVTASVGRTDKYVLGNAYGLNYGDIFDRAELKYSNDNFAVTAGYGKFKMNGSDKTVAGDANPDNSDLYISGVKTGYGEIEGFFGNGSAVGVYYNDFTRADGTNGTYVDADNKTHNDSFKGDDLLGAYASFNLGSKWNLLANYEQVNLSDGVKNINGDDSAALWIAQLTYGKADKSVPGTWSAWVEYLNVEDGAYLGGSTNSWRFDSKNLNNIESWGVGASYVFAKNATFNVMQSFASSLKDNPKNDADPEEQTRAEFVFAF